MERAMCLGSGWSVGGSEGLVWITWLRIPHVAAVTVLPLEEGSGRRRRIWKLAGHPFLSCLCNLGAS